MGDNLTDQQIWDQEAAGEQLPVETVPEAVPEEPIVEDPFSGLNDAVKAKLSKIDDLEKLNATLMHELKSTIGRVGAMQRELDLAKHAKQQAQSEGGDAPTNAQINAAATSSKKWEQLKADFPDWADAIEERFLGAQSSAQAGVSPDEIVNFVAGQVSSTRAEIARDIELAKIEVRHEDWTETVKTEDFATWFGQQSAEIQALAESDKARDAIRMLDLYEKARAKPVAGVKQERGARLAVAATQVGQSAPPPKDVDSMTAEELWAYEAKLRDKRKQAI